MRGCRKVNAGIVLPPEWKLERGLQDLQIQKFSLTV